MLSKSVAWIEGIFFCGSELDWIDGIGNYDRRCSGLDMMFFS